MIEFPNLGPLSFSINVKRSFSFFGIIDIYWYGVIIAIAFALAVFLAIRESKKFGIEEENIIDLAIVAVPISIICARLYYVIFDWGQFKDNYLSIFNTRLGGLAIYGGIIGAIISASIFARFKKISVLKLFDFTMPYVVLAQAIGRWGNFINQEAFGTNTNLPWGMTGNNIKNYLETNQTTLLKHGINVNPYLPVHPTFLYESLWNLAAFVFLMWFRKRKKVEGEVFFLYMVLYGVGRAWIESLRTDSLMLGTFRVSQLLAIIFAATFMVIFLVRRRIAASDIEDEDNEAIFSKYSSIIKEMEEETNTIEAACERKLTTEDSCEENTNANSIGSEVPVNEDAVADNEAPESNSKDKSSRLRD